MSQKENGTRKSSRFFPLWQWGCWLLTRTLIATQFGANRWWYPYLDDDHVSLISVWLGSQISAHKQWTSVSFRITHSIVVFFSAYQPVMTSFTSFLRLLTFSAWLELWRQILFLNSLANWRRRYEETTNVRDIRYGQRLHRNRPKYVLDKTVDRIVVVLHCFRGWCEEWFRT